MNFIKSIVLTLAVVLTTVGVGFATDIEPTKFVITKTLEEKKIVIDLSDMEAEKIICTILDERGTVVHSKKINRSTESNRKKYDLSNLENGNYTISIDDLLKVETFAFEIKDNDILFNRSESETIFKPVVWLNQDRTVDFNLLAFGNDVEVNILSDGNVLHTERFENEITINKVFNLESLPAGEYTMVIYHRDQVFYRYLTIS